MDGTKQTQHAIKTSENLELHTENINNNIDKEFPDKGLQNPQKFTVIHKKTKKEIGTFTLAPMIGCCGIIISTALYLNKEYRSTPISKEFMQLKEWTPLYLGYSAVIATIREDNIAEIKSSTKRNYKTIARWRNDRTGANLALIFKQTGL